MQQNPASNTYLDKIIEMYIFFQLQVDSSQFINFFCEHVLPRWDEIVIAEGGTDTKLELLKIFSEMSEFCSVITDSQKKIDTVYDVLMVCAHFL